MTRAHEHRQQIRSGIVCALLAAALFGASTPMIKLLPVQLPALALAGMLYLGSGIGLLAGRQAVSMFRHGASNAGNPVTAKDLPWLACAIACGGIAAPPLLMYGLAHASASATSLLLNLEVVFTAVLAWLVFKENVDRRLMLGMLCILAASAILSWEQLPDWREPWAVLAIVGACLCWGLDNNFTRKVAASDAAQIAGLKGLVAGTVNLSLACGLGFALPPLGTMSWLGAVGFLGYGLSLVLFVLALRKLGTARTGAYFSTAPFIGAILSLVLLGEPASRFFWLAAMLMAVGLVLHLREVHEHEHEHEELAHAHRHVHDAHHQHEHDFPWDGEEPHTHPHVHAPIRHSHVHVPDIHHRHAH